MPFYATPFFKKPMEGWSRHDMWEGCLSFELPGVCTDCRSLRDLPQNQEVFLGVGKDSFSVDMLELLADEPTDERAARAHWKEIGDISEAEQTKEEYFRVFKVLEGSKSVAVVAGMHDHVRVWVALFRLREQETDMLVCWNQVDNVGSVDRDAVVFERIITSVKINDISFLKQ